MYFFIQIAVNEEQTTKMPVAVTSVLQSVGHKIPALLAGERVNMVMRGSQGRLTPWQRSRPQRRGKFWINFCHSAENKSQKTTQIFWLCLKKIIIIKSGNVFKKKKSRDDRTGTLIKATTAELLLILQQNGVLLT